MVRYGGAGLGGGFGGSYVEVAVDLDGVGPDDFAVEGLGQLKGQAAFAGGGGACDDEDVGDRGGHGGALV